MYNHNQYAGNHGDQLKHLLLRITLEHLKETRPEPLRFLDTHASEGIYLDNNGDVYKGSTAIAAEVLNRASDNVVACDINIQAVEKLKANVPSAEVFQQNGFYGHNELLADMVYHNCILIDPPCQDYDDYFEILGLAAKVSRHKNNTLLVWLPQKLADRYSNNVIANLTNVFQDRWVNAFTTTRFALTDGVDMFGSTVVCCTDDTKLLAKLSDARYLLQEKFNKITK